MPHYDKVGEPTLMTVQTYWFGAEQQTANGWLRRGQVLAEDGRTGVASLIEFNGPERQNGELKGMFQIVDVTPDKGDSYTQYQFLG
jgi:hypothetical protein